MASTIKLKNGSGAPTSGQLVQGEPALDLTNKRLYTENASGTVIEVGTNPAAEITANGGIALPDNQKATFGASDDLQIYHDGSNSYIDDQGTGSLVLQSNGAFTVIQNSSGVANARFDSAGAASLRYNGAEKFVTTATGIDVTGTVTADGLTVGTSNVQISGGTPLIDLQEVDQTDLNTRIKNGSAGFYIQTANDARTAFTNRLLIDHATGDLSLYEDTGTTAKFFWDASAESLGIGTTAPSLAPFTAAATGLHIQGLAPGLRLQDTSGEETYIVQLNENLYINNKAAGPIRFSTDSTERMRIDSSGNVGIGTTSPATGLVVETSNYTYASTNYDIYGLFGTTSGGIRLGNDSVTGAGVIGAVGQNPIAFVTYNGSSWGERMRIDSAGNVGIGTSSPAEKLHIESSTNGEQVDIRFRGLTTTTGAGRSANIGYDPDPNDTGTSSEAQLYLSADTVNKTLVATAAGNVGIGTTSPSAQIDVSSSGNTTIEITSGDSNSGNIFFGDSADTNAGYILYDHASNFMAFRTNGSGEDMRIDSSGNLLVGTTSTTTSTTGFKWRADLDRLITVANGASSASFGRLTSDGEIVLFQKDGTTVGSISVTASATAYNTSSDERLKENITDAPAGNIDAIKVRSFDWKADGSHQDYGMVAQELEAVAPYAVTKGETEDDMWSVDYSKLVPMLIKEIQDLKAEVAALKGA